MSRSYYICSIGQPGQGYDDENLRRCIVSNCFVLHEDAKQKGCINDIEIDDILILKYQNELIGYGRATNPVISVGTGWSLQVSVNLWIMGNHVHKYGIKDAQQAGSNYDAVKKVDRDFALQKMEEIGFPF